MLARAQPDKTLDWLELRFVMGGEAAFAIDHAGYYEMIGEVPPAVRVAASCGPQRPLEMCADRWETPGIVASVLAGDLSYRTP